MIFLHECITAHLQNALQKTKKMHVQLFIIKLFIFIFKNVNTKPQFITRDKWCIIFHTDAMQPAQSHFKTKT